MKSVQNIRACISSQFYCTTNVYIKIKAVPMNHQKKTHKKINLFTFYLFIWVKSKTF